MKPRDHTRPPQAAVQAAAEALYEISKTSDMRHQPDFTPTTFETDARAALAAALPLLSDTTWGVRTPEGQVLTYKTEHGARLAVLDGDVVVYRISGEWTEAPSE